jgi:hypothetical protein
MATKPKSDRLQKIRSEHWPMVDLWTGGEYDKGWFKAPRTLPLILALMQSKQLTGNADPTRVYLELLSRQFGEGVVEIQNEGEHAYAAGYTSSRAVRTWQDQMRCLEKLGFIKIKGIGKHAFKYVALVHPVAALEELRQKNLVPQDWWDAFTDRRIQTGELSYEQRTALQQRTKIKRIDQAQSAG